jgi:hypothetical protein
MTVFSLSLDLAHRSGFQLEKRLAVKRHNGDPVVFTHCIGCNLSDSCLGSVQVALIGSMMLDIDYLLVTIITLNRTPTPHVKLEI